MVQAFVVAAIVGLAVGGCSPFKSTPLGPNESFGPPAPNPAAVSAPGPANGTKAAAACGERTAQKFNQITQDTIKLWNQDGEQMRAHCKALGLEVPDSGSLQGVFTFQGDYGRIAAGGADELVCRLARYKAVYLTNAFAVLHENSTLTPKDEDSDCAARTSARNRFSYQDPYLIFRNGRSHLDPNAFMSGAYQDSHGRGLFYVMSKLRHLHGAHIQIYGYISATADNVNGIWSNLIPAQNYLCPDGVCIDSLHFVEKWRGMENVEFNSYLDGFFIDMAHEFYVNSATLANIVSYIRAQKSVSGQSFKLIFNTLDTGRSSYYPGGDGTKAVVESRQRAIPWVSQFAVPGDSVFIEGFVFKAGQTPGDLAATGQDLLALPAGVRWSAIASETTYFTPMSLWNYESMRALYLDLYADLGGLSLDQAYRVYTQNLQELSRLNSGLYWHPYSTGGMQKMIVDMNYLRLAKAQHGADLTSDQLCSTIQGEIQKHIAAGVLVSSFSGAAITTQETSASCYESAKRMDCGSARFATAKMYFNAWNGENLVYHEGGMGTWSGRPFDGCFYSR